MLFGWLMVVLTVTFTVFGQIIVKWQIAMVEPPQGSVADFLLWGLRLFFNPWIMFMFVLAIGAATAWFFAMSRLPLSQAYPFVGLTFPLVVMASALLLGEQVSLLHVAGTGLIVLGVALVGYASA